MQLSMTTGLPRRLGGRAVTRMAIDAKRNWPTPRSTSSRLSETSSVRRPSVSVMSSEWPRSVAAVTQPRISSPANGSVPTVSEMNPIDGACTGNEAPIGLRGT